MGVKNVLMSYQYIHSSFYSISAAVGSFWTLVFNKTPYLRIQKEVELNHFQII